MLNQFRGWLFEFSIFSLRDFFNFLDQISSAILNPFIPYFLIRLVKFFMSKRYDQVCIHQDQTSIIHLFDIPCPDHPHSRRFPSMAAVEYCLFALISSPFPNRYAFPRGTSSSKNVPNLFSWCKHVPNLLTLFFFHCSQNLISFSEYLNWVVKTANFFKDSFSSIFLKSFCKRSYCSQVTAAHFSQLKDSSSEHTYSFG